MGGETHTSDYTYDRDNRVTEIDYDGTTEKVTYAYDALGRITTRTAENGTTAGKLTSTYSYISGGYGTNSTTALISEITQSTGAGSAMNFSYQKQPHNGNSLPRDKPITRTAIPETNL